MSKNDRIQDVHAGEAEKSRQKAIEDKKQRRLNIAMLCAIAFVVILMYIACHTSP